MLFIMAGGGTGGHVVPLLAVAAELRAMGHACLFIGTRRGIENRLVPQAGFPLEWIEAWGFQRAGIGGRLRALASLPPAFWRSLRLMRRVRPAGLFSMGGYAAAAPMLAAAAARVPMVLMEPNAMPGLVNRRLARFAARALVSFEEALPWFPAGRTELCGLPVRPAFFDIRWEPPQEALRILVVGGSRGSRALNRAVAESLPLFRRAPFRAEITLQAGEAEAEALDRELAASGVPGRAVAFLDDMPAAYAQAHLVVSRAGAGAVAELAAAGMPSILVPFPHAADNHQFHNAEAMRRAGAAVLLEEARLSGQALYEEAARLASSPGELERMSRAARALARPGAARRAAEALAGAARGRAEDSLTGGRKP
ncbi:MAG: undecaprenyldiphospho-muramoylpentapeptide beta-N-acetylglucosaminyltransferase [Bryobacteraceae bacterium]|nr:undecaprenyldiphospho-muramoylpentapeptide beta-N-acetylglucosaminyltransferase [Bryobacteraceae bacterium]